MQRLTTPLITDIADTRNIFKKGYKHIVVVLFDILLSQKNTIDSPTVNVDKNGAAFGDRHKRAKLNSTP